MFNRNHVFPTASRHRFVLLALAYSAICFTSLWLAYQLRFDFGVPAQYREQMFWTFLWVIPLKLLLIELFRQFDPALSFYSTPDLFKLFFALLSASVAMLIMFLFLGTDYAPPRSVILADFFLSFVGIAGMRLAIRIYWQQVDSRNKGDDGSLQRVGVIGTDDAAANLVKDLFLRSGLKRKPVAFFDHDPQKYGSRIHDVPIAGPPELILEEKYRESLDEVIIAMPGAPAKQIRDIIGVLQKAKIKYTTIPSIHQLATGKFRVSQLRAVGVEDLLDTSPTDISTDRIAAGIKDRTILVTGSGGSVGSEICRQILVHNPKKLLLVEQSEVQLFQIEQEFLRHGHDGLIEPLIGNITDDSRMGEIFKRYRPEIVFHAAAHKYAPIMESHPGEVLKNNTFGTAQLARLARENGAGQFVFLSVDNALGPSTVTGASKRIAEMYLQALQKAHPDGTRFTSVRFANVLGSAGSFIHSFQRQIENGGPVKVIHRDAVRHFITVSEASALILESMTMSTGGDIYYLNAGQSLKIIDLAKQMIELSGLQPETDVALEFTGLRPGERLVEIYHPDENQAEETPHPKILRMKPSSHPALDLDELNKWFSEIHKLLYEAETNHLKSRLKSIIPEYDPYLE